jgi:hypothetical protein
MKNISSSSSFQRRLLSIKNHLLKFGGNNNNNNMSSANNNTAATTTTKEEREEAAKLRTATTTTKSIIDVLDGLPEVEIHFDSIQKYVLIQVQIQDGTLRHFVRGDKNAPYHKDVARPLVSELKHRGCAYTVLGGGRIEHTSSGFIKIYGFSYGFPWINGQSKHSVTASIMERVFSGFRVEWSDEGY